jgi:hypothetical protein
MKRGYVTVGENLRSPPPSLSRRSAVQKPAVPASSLFATGRLVPPERCLKGEAGVIQ